MGTLTPLYTRITDPDSEGRRRFVLYFDGANFNDTTMYANASALPWLYGNDVRITSVRASYTGTIGVILYGLVWSSGKSLPLLPQVITTTSPDYWTWLDKASICVPQNQGYVLQVYPVGYASSDDMVIVLEGEVW